MQKGRIGFFQRKPDRHPVRAQRLDFLDKPRQPCAMPIRKFGSISAEDVLFTFNRMRDPNMPFRRADTTEFPYWHGTGLARLVEKIEALGADRMAVRFTLKE